MKKMELELHNGLQELSVEEAEAINGGESLWFWIGYGIGYVAHAISSVTGS
jgi:hypothetical protein